MIKIYPEATCDDAMVYLLSGYSKSSLQIPIEVKLKF